MKNLQIGYDFALPYEAVTQTFAILAKRGVGKTYTAARMVEQMLKASLPVCVIDPVGAWWGLRSSADGKSKGFPITVLGGDHGDLPLSENMGEVVANLLVDRRLPLVIDLGNLRKGQQTRFMTAFAETLYHRNREPLHLVLDEGDAFAPQKPMKGQERMLGAIEDIVRRGRLRGLGVTLISQRPAVINKDVLTQIETLVALRMIGPQDLDALDNWIKRHDVYDKRAEFMASLPSLPVGTAWFWSPGWLDTFQQIEVLPRETFDSSATPRIGEVKVQPQTLADVDIDLLRQALEGSLEQAEMQDVASLQRRVKELQRQLTEKPKTEIQRVEVPVLRDEQIAELRTLAGEMIKQAQSLLAFGQDILVLIEQAQPPAAPPPAPVRPQVERAALPASVVESDDLSTGLKAGEIGILKAIARRHPTQLTLSEIATLSGRSIKSSSFQSAISKMKNLGFVYGGKSGMSMTDTGLNYLGDDIPSQPQTTEELLAMWADALPQGAYRILDILVQAHPRSLTKLEVSARSSYSITSSGFQGYLSLLRRNGLIELNGGDVAASATLFIDREAVR